MEVFTLNGWHGTTPQNSRAILDSQNIKVRPFSIKSDLNIPGGQSLPSDLGQGLYLFVDNKESNFDGLENAKAYANVFRHENNKIAVIHFSFDESGLECLDFNEEENTNLFIQVRKKIYQRIKCQLGVFKDSKALKRANLDGIIIEYLIQNRYQNKVGFVVKDTYTPFDDDFRTLSNFPNGRELCLRKLETIDWENTKEAE